ncbi:MAG: UTP--glucose-1-phosphate uridylyltransferase [Deltaproteobacteria bacterium]|nr:UTP--glucose-1-phosphate uridylyltransferase [Deltaproteobacteria bacterium]
MSDAPPLAASLAALDPTLVSHLEAAGFDKARFVALAETLREGDAATRRRTRNCVKGAVEAPKPGEIGKLPPEGSAEEAALRAKGEAAMRNGELAFCTMAGGMATRMGGIVKALADALPGHSFLSMRLAENATASAKAGHAIPLWLMTSEATHQAIVDALKAAQAPAHVGAFMQNLSLRLTPEGGLFFDDEGKPSTYATGHGDLVDALRRSGMLDAFVARGGRYVWITNVDNLGAAIDPVVLGHFIAQTEKGIDVQCEVCRKEGDKGGIPVHAEGKLQVLEEFRLPPEFDPTAVNVFNTNTFLVRAEPLARQPLTWTYFEVEKKVDGRTAIQFERLIQEITAYMPSTYLEVPRDGAGSRFLPVKDFDELAKRRANIEVVARARGMV